MDAPQRILRLLVVFGIGIAWIAGVIVGASFLSTHVPTPAVRATFTPTRTSFTAADVYAVAVVATYEGQVFPEPLRSQAYAAIAWTMRNRVEIGFGDTVGYTDERLLSRYLSYAEHKDDPPDPRALEIAREVLGADTCEGDPTRGARHFVDHSYWTGTHAQTGAAVKVRGKFSDVDVRRLVEEGRFTLVIEWKTSADHSKGALIYGLYFFDYWPPATPVVTPTFTPTRTRTATVTRTPARTATPTLIATQAITATGTVTPLPVTPTPVSLSGE